ncbi:MAG: YceI family protein [Pseudomonadota bacterium]
MRKQFLSVAAAGAMALMSTMAQAGGWTLSAENSKIAFGSVKKDVVGESHHFTGLSGSVSEDGTAQIEIDVASVETLIDIRNERMLKHVFDSINFPKAVISASFDMDEVSSLKPGEAKVIDTEAVLGLVGQEIEIFTELFVVAVADDKVLVTTDEMIMLSTEELGINPGVDELMKLAKLPSITRSTPVTLRLMFVKN